MAATWRREPLREAVAAYDLAADGFLAQGELRRAVRCLRRASDIDCDAGYLAPAHQRRRRVLRLSGELGDPTLLAAALNDLAAVEVALGRIDEGFRRAREALQASLAAGSSAEEARALENLAEIDYSRGDLRDAIRQIGRAFGIWSELDNAEGRIRTMMALGDCRSDLGQMDDALQLFEDAAELSKTMGDPRREAIALTSIGRLKSRVAGWEEAFGCFSRARSILEPIGDRVWEASIWNGLGFVYESLGRPDLAVDHYLEAVRRFEAAGLLNAVADNLHDAGRACFKAGDRSAAIKHLGHALQMGRKMGDRRLEAWVLGDLGIVREAGGDSAEASRLYQEALGVHRREGDLRGQAFVLNRIGLLNESNGPEAALEFYRQALPAARLAADRRAETRTLHNLARMERRVGRLENALARIQLSIQLDEQMRTDVADLDLRATFWATAQDSYRLLVDLLMDSHRRNPHRGFADAAFEASERLRARSLLDLLQAAGAKAEAPSRRAGETVAVRLPGAPPAGPRLPALAEARPLTLKEIQAEILGPDTLLLEYLLGEERSFVWAVSSAGASVEALPPRRELESLARDYHQILTDPRRIEEKLLRAGGSGEGSGEASRRAAALSRALLGPVASRIRGRRLLLVTEGALQYVPFAALPDPVSLDSATPVPLVVGHEIVSLPSASALAVLRREFGSRAPAPKTVAIFADPVFASGDARVRRARERDPTVDASPDSLHSALRGADGDSAAFSRLPNSRRESQAIAALAEPGSVRSALDFDANREAALDRRMRDYRILHFATHGVIDAQRPERSAIVLSLLDQDGRPVDGFLRLPDIYNLELAADLVVLSACQTALGKEVRGEGLIGLTRGFMHAGARRVLASLWKVEDRATAELMERFYEAVLRRAMAPGKALRRAQVSMLEGDNPLWRDPFFWAGFVLQGELD